MHPKHQYRPRRPHGPSATGDDAGLIRSIARHHETEGALATPDTIAQLVELAHDLNNQLTVLFGFTDLLLMRLPPEGESHTHALEARKAAERAAALTRRLMALGRRHAGAAGASPPSTPAEA